MTPTPAASEQLLPCPFCGSDKLWNNRSNSSKNHVRANYNSVRCSVCRARGPNETHVKQAKDSWNRRALSRLREEVIEECARICDRHANDAAWSDDHSIQAQWADARAVMLAGAIRSLHAQPVDEKETQPVRPQNVRK